MELFFIILFFHKQVEEIAWKKRPQRTRQEMAIKIVNKQCLAIAEIY